MAKSRLARRILALGAVVLWGSVAIYATNAQGPGRSPAERGPQPARPVTQPARVEEPGRPVTQPAWPGQSPASGPVGGAPNVNHHHYYGSGPSGPGAYGPGSGYGDSNYITNPAAARGEYNLDTAQAVDTLTQARSQSIQNHNYAVHSYYSNKELHDQYEAATREAPVSESRAEYIARKLAPGRLSPGQFDATTNVIHWPPLLRDPQFSDARYKLDQLFHQRTPDTSGVDSDNCEQIQQECDAIEETLKGMITQMPPATYIAAKHFITSLAYEARFAAQ